MSATNCDCSETTMWKFMQYDIRAEKNEMIYEKFWKKLFKTQWIIEMQSNWLLSWRILKEAFQISFYFIHFLSTFFTSQIFLFLSIFSIFLLLLSIILFFLKSLFTMCFTWFLSFLLLNVIIRNLKISKIRKKSKFLMNFDEMIEEIWIWCCVIWKLLSEFLMKEIDLYTCFADYHMMWLKSFFQNSHKSSCDVSIFYWLVSATSSFLRIIMNDLQHLLWMN